MIRCEPVKGDKVKVTFTLPADEPEGKVAVAGDFNDWDTSATTLRKRGDKRSASVTLDAGRRYAFRYCTADGSWFNDEEAHGYERNDFGEENAIIDLSDGAAG
ncbi:MAG TPA: isoamylase early set domain-containing protein [Acidimicrobiales bacterium]|nr:isoamylase early set domain-containing protein [Acidimicrobiales bacterium]